MQPPICLAAGLPIGQNCREAGKPGIANVPRLNECQIIGPYPFGIPTLRGYPPPAPSRQPSFHQRPTQRRAPPLASAPVPVRSPSYRRFHNCMFLPNFDDVAEFVEARRRILELDSKVHPRHIAKREPRFTSPLVIGLMLAVLPPLAVTLVWSSPHFVHAAKVAVTIYGMFTFVALLATIMLALHS